jgi:EpsD family peptidyl-prolyl cis-trans isomerase
MNKTRFVVVLIMTLGILQSAWSGEEDKEDKGQVAVKVNGQPIMATAFGFKPGLSPSGLVLAPVSTSDMKSMVDLELLRQAAVEAKLDHDEKVREELAKAPNRERKTLAFVFIRKQLASVPAPTDAEVKAYYNSNPLQFAQRKRYELQTCAVRRVPGDEAQLKAELARSKKVDDFERWLTANKVQHGCTPVSVDSARANEKSMQILANVPVGGSIAQEAKDWISITFVKEMKNDSLSLDQAEEQITKTLTHKKRAAAYAEMVKQLRGKAQIEYVPPYTASGVTKKALAMPGENEQ